MDNNNQNNITSEQNTALVEAAIVARVTLNSLIWVQPFGGEEVSEMLRQTLQ